MTVLAYIDPDTFSIHAPDVAWPVSAQRWSEIRWPDCPVCGATVLVDRVDVRSAANPFPVYVMGRWDCPNHCDQRTGKAIA